MTSARGPHWYFIPIRVLVVTFLLTVMSFAISLLLAIVAIAVIALVRGTHPDMTLAYRLVAVPVAAVIAVVVLAGMVILEIRRYWQAKALAAIERAS